MAETKGGKQWIGSNRKQWTKRGLESKDMKNIKLLRDYKSSVLFSTFNLLITHRDIILDSFY